MNSTLNNLPVFIAAYWTGLGIATLRSKLLEPTQQPRCRGPPIEDSREEPTGLEAEYQSSSESTPVVLEESNFAQTSNIFEDAVPRHRRRSAKISLISRDSITNSPRKAERQRTRGYDLSTRGLRRPYCKKGLSTTKRHRFRGFPKHLSGDLLVAYPYGRKPVWPIRSYSMAGRRLEPTWKVIDDHITQIILSGQGI